MLLSSILGLRPCLDEQDAFESDFESTDEEGAQEDVDAAAERMVRDEEKQKKKVYSSTTSINGVRTDSTLPRQHGRNWIKSLRLPMLVRRLRSTPNQYLHRRRGRRLPR